MTDAKPREANTHYRQTCAVAEQARETRDSAVRQAIGRAGPAESPRAEQKPRTANSTRA
jgi:hypothetical protein